MYVGRTGAERNVRELASRLYGVKPDSNAGRAAEAALLDANPHLSKVEELPTGTPVLVPDLSAATPAPSEVQPLEVAGAVAIATQLEGALGDVHKALGGSLKAQTAEAKQVVAVKTRKAKDRIGNDPLVKRELARAQATVDSAPATEKQLNELIGQMRSDLKTLVSGL